VRERPIASCLSVLAQSDFSPHENWALPCACGSAILHTARLVITISWSRPDLASAILRVSHLSLHPADQLGRLNQFYSVAHTNVQCAFVLGYVVSVTGCLITRPGPTTLLRFLGPFTQLSNTIQGLMKTTRMPS